jgi:hypothetical protein
LAHAVALDTSADRNSRTVPRTSIGAPKDPLHQRPWFHILHSETLYVNCPIIDLRPKPKDSKQKCPTVSHPDSASNTSPPLGDLSPATPYPVLIRATNSKSKKDKIKLATVVQSDQLPGFYAKYADVCRVGMTGLKKRDRSKGKKKKKDKKDGVKA